MMLAIVQEESNHILFFVRVKFIQTIGTTIIQEFSGGYFSKLKTIFLLK